MNKIKTLFVVSLLLTCMYIPCIAAAGNNGGLHVYDAKVNKTIRQAQAANVRAGSAGMGMAADAQAMRRAGRNDLQRARETYRNDKTPENQQMLTDAAKDHLLQMLDLMIGRLELLQERIEFAEENNNMVPEGASENIDRYTLRLEGYKQEARSADTPADIRSVARSINQEWRSIRREILHYAKYMVAVRIEAYIDKANDISDRLDAKISELEGEGVYTTNMRQNLDAFDEELVCVEENYGLAKDAVSDDEINPGEVQQYIRNSSRCIREANNILREMFRELRALEYEIGIGASVSEADESAGDDSADETAAYETVNETADDPANESDSGTDEDGDGDADASGNETESESRTDDGEVES
ncbi:MAG: hypothetical protein U9N09_06630 [Euryarchaeota archaeon]|nr:hypothetical protein [Euryarchaeota archaeon]